jgi:hypothetical protein
MAIPARNGEHGGMQAIALDQRQAERHEVREPAMVSVVGTPGLVLHGEMRNVSETGTQIRLDQALPPSTLVRIEYGDNLLLGEVVYCRQEQSGWLVGLRVEHGLFGLTALAAAMQAF